MTLPDGALSRAVLVGTRSYNTSSGLSELPGVTGNVIDLGKALTSLTGLPVAHCPTLLDRTDDREVCQEVRRAAREAEDLLLVYFAGHGLIDPETNELFLALSHSAPDAPLYNAVRFTEIREAMASSRARNRVLILDCCFSGRAIADTMGSAADGLALAQTETRGACTLTATSANLPSIARPGARYTAFTGALLELLHNGIPDAGPYLTIDTVFAELCHRLDPLPRQQGTDNVGQLALAPNPLHQPTMSGPDFTAVSAQAIGFPAAPATLTFPTDRRRVRLRRLLSFTGQLALIIGVVTARQLGLLGPVGFWLTTELIVALVVGAALAGLGGPAVYELRVGAEGLHLDIGARIGHGRHGVQLAWHDIEQVTTMRRRPTDAAPNQLVVWTRRGFVPPKSGWYGPRPYRRGDRTLRFCDLQRLRAGLTEVEQAVAHHAGALWDPANGLSDATSARFVKSRRDTAHMATWACLLASLAALGLVGVHQRADRWPSALLVAAGWFWLLALSLLAAWALALAVLPQSLTIDEQSVQIRHGWARLSLSWEQITEVSVDDSRFGGVLHLAVRLPSAPRAAKAFRVRGVSPTDRLRFLLGNVSVTTREIETLLARLAGSRWTAPGNEPRLGPASNADATVFTGRLMGPRSKIVGTVGLAIGAAAVPFILARGDWLALATVLAGTMVVLFGRLVVLLSERVTLTVDSQVLELKAGKRLTRLSWGEVSRVSVITVNQNTVSARTTQALVIWLKEDAPVPPKWPGRHCFSLHSGGLQVVNISPLNGLRASPQDIAAAVSHQAGQAWRG